jgi:hypothetical protein
MALFNFRKKSDNTSKASGSASVETSKFSKTIGGKTISIFCASELSSQAEYLLSVLDDETRGSIRDGYIIQMGWSMFIIKQTGDEYILNTPDFFGNPFTDTTIDATTAIAIQMQQNDILRQAKIEGAQVSFQDTVVILKDALEANALYFERQATDTEGDSGWYLGLLEDNDSSERPPSDYISVYTYQLLTIKPLLLKLLALPAGCIAVIMNDEIVEVVDSNDERIL